MMKKTAVFILIRWLGIQRCTQTSINFHRLKPIIGINKICVYSQLLAAVHIRVDTVPVEQPSKTNQRSHFSC